MYFGLAVLLVGLGGLIGNIRQTMMSSFLKCEIAIVAFLFGTLMFASSYVEEEQQFWYWITTSHFFLAYLRRYLLLHRWSYKPSHQVVSGRRILIDSSPNTHPAPHSPLESDW
jgi:hypothetical protein